MAESLGTATLTLDANAGPLDSVLTATEAGVLGRFKSMAGNTKQMVGAALGVVGALAIAVGKGLYDIGEQFDDAYDKIETGTGATGKALEGLKDDFRDVVGSVPTDFDSASTAISELHRRLGITGEPLRALSKQLLELSRITGTDLSENIESVTRLFGDWGIATKDQGPTLDKLFRLSQQTGVSISDLSRNMVQFGSPLRQLGLDFDTSAAMFAKFEKEGVNVQTLMPGLRMALKNFSEAGVDPAKGLRDTFDAIKNAGSAAKANQIAFETFGTRAGPDMAAAIREGRFELDDLIDQMENGRGTIRDSGRDTMDLTEQWQLFKNRGMLLLEPVATRVFSLLGQGMKWLNDNWPAIVANINKATDWLKQAWEDLGPAIKFVVTTVGYELGILKAVFVEMFNVIKGVVEIFVAAINGDFSGMWDGIKDLFKGAAEGVIGIMKAMVAPIRDIAKTIGNAIMDGVSKAAAIPEKLAGWLGNGLDKIVGYLDRFKDKALQLGNKIVSGLAEGISDFVSKIADTLGKGLDRVASFFDSFLSKATTLGNKIVSGVGQGLSDLVEKIGDKIGAGVSRIADFFEDAFSKGVTFGNKVVNGIGQAIADVGKTVAGALNQAVHAVGSVVGNIGRAIADWINDNTPLGDEIGIDIPHGPDIHFTLPALATGARNFMGGWAMVGEKGPELVNLPSGSDVFTAADTRSMLSGADSVATPPINLYIEGDASALDYRIVKITRGEITEHDHRGTQALRAGLVRA